MKKLALVLLSFGFIAGTHAANYFDTTSRTTSNAQSAISDNEITQEVNGLLEDGWFTSGYKQVTATVSNGIVTLQGSVPSQDDKIQLEQDVKSIDGVRSLKSQLQVSPTATNGQTTTSTQSYNGQTIRNGQNLRGQDLRNIDRSATQQFNRNAPALQQFNRNAPAGQQFNRNGQQTPNMNLQITETTTDFPQDSYATDTDKRLNAKIRNTTSDGYFWDSYTDVKLRTKNGVVFLEGSVDSLEDQQELINAIRKIDGVKSVKSNLSLVETTN